jgi:hypothetical protein
MSFSLGGSSASNNSSSNSQLDPEIKNRWLQLEGRADDAYNTIRDGVQSGAYNLDPQQMVAPLNGIQQDAIGVARQIAGTGPGGDQVRQASALASSLPTAQSMANDPHLTQTASYRPAYEIQESLAGPTPYVPAYEIQESTAGPASTYGGAQIGPASTYGGAQIAPLSIYGGAQTDLSRLPGLSAQTAAQGAATYKDLYNSNVIDPVLKDLFRAKQMTDTQNAAAATQAGAFGGSRHGVVDAETNRAFADEAAKTAANLQQSGFNTIAGLAQSDADRALAADTSRYGTTAGLLQANTANLQQAGLSAADAANARAQAQAGLLQQAGLASADAQNQRAQQQAQLEQQAGLAGAEARNNMAQFNATQSQNADVFNANNENNAADLMAQYQQSNSQFNAGQSQAADVFNANNENQAAWANSAAKDQASADNANRYLQALTSGGQLQLSGAQTLGNLGQQIHSDAMDNYNLLKDAGATAQQNAQQFADANTQAKQWNMQLPMQALNAYLPAFGNAVPTVSSGGTTTGTTNSRGKQSGVGWG